MTFSQAAPGDRVLDAGCGTGIVARTALGRVAPTGRVAGVDLNEGMIAEARQQDSGGQIQWLVAPLEALPFDDHHFDQVLSQQVLQFVPARNAVLAEAHRVLKPGGLLALAVLRDLTFNRSYDALASVLDRHAGTQVGDMMRSPFSGPDADTLREELAAAGFRRVVVQHDILAVRFPSASEYLRQEVASSPLAGPMSELQPATLEALIADLDQALAPFRDDDGITFPMETYLVRAER